jgi:hypothetical protein
MPIDVDDNVRHTVVLPRGCGLDTYSGSPSTGPRSDGASLTRSTRWRQGWTSNFHVHGLWAARLRVGPTDAARISRARQDDRPCAAASVVWRGCGDRSGFVTASRGARQKTKPATAATVAAAISIARPSPSTKADCACAARAHPWGRAAWRSPARPAVRPALGGPRWREGARRRRRHRCGSGR